MIGNPNIQTDKKRLLLYTYGWMDIQNVHLFKFKIGMEKNSSILELNFLQSHFSSGNINSYFEYSGIQDLGHSFQI